MEKIKIGFVPSQIIGYEASMFILGLTGLFSGDRNYSERVKLLRDRINLITDKLG